MAIPQSFVEGFQTYDEQQGGGSAPTPRDGRAQINGRVNGTLFDSIRTAGLAADNIVVGDGNHTDLETRQLLSSEDMMKSLAEAGCAHVCIEVDAGMDYLAQQYASGQITREHFINTLSIFLDVINPGEVTEGDFLNSVADTIDNAKKFGMDVHFVDNDISNLQVNLSRESERLLSRAIRRYQHETGNRINQNSSPHDLQQFFKYMDDHHLLTAEQWGTLRQDFIAARTNDEALYNNVQAVTNGEKTAVIYGAGHDDLVRRMGGSPLVVDVYSDPAQYNRSQLNELPGFNTAGEPDIVHITDGSQTYVTDEADPHLTGGLSTQPASEPLPEAVATGQDLAAPDRAPTGQTPR
ncbi:MAG: hypothetical protein KDI61_13005 [Alphaproteobacteria bacterium]|nr:hypothetical protein [Alphaproteobacteria bacterium]